MAGYVDEMLSRLGIDGGIVVTFATHTQGVADADAGSDGLINVSQSWDWVHNYMRRQHSVPNNENCMKRRRQYSRSFMKFGYQLQVNVTNAVEVTSLLTPYAVQYAHLAVSSTLPPRWVEDNMGLIQGELHGHRFGFICGWTSSGTSLIKLLLGLHPDVSTMTGVGTPTHENEGWFSVSFFLVVMIQLNEIK